MLFDCPTGHPLVPVNFAKYSRRWICNVCKNKFKGTSNRWRCAEKCNYDLCSSCMQPYLQRHQLASQMDTQFVIADSVDASPSRRGSLSPGAKHKHPLAPIEFTCRRCGIGDQGFRMYCSACLYDLCRACTVKQMLGGTEADEVDSICLGTNPKPFAVGASREAYKVEATMRNGRNIQLVLKRWKDDFLREGYDMAEAVRVHLEAHRLAEIYRKEYKTNRPVRFYRPTLYTIDETIESDAKMLMEKGEVVVLEAFIDGEFEKFNSNSGWSSKKYYAPDAFTHFTWHYTRSLIVCDLEGHRRVHGDVNDGYYLTDPAICSLDKQWGFTDLGMPGIFNFFNNHECSDLCQHWDVPDLQALTCPSAVLEETTYVIPRAELSVVEIDMDSPSHTVATPTTFDSDTLIAGSDEATTKSSNDSDIETEKIRKRSVRTARAIEKFQVAVDALQRGDDVAF